MASLTPIGIDWVLINLDNMQLDSVIMNLDNNTSAFTVYCRQITFTFYEACWGTLIFGRTSQASFAWFTYFTFFTFFRTLLDTSLRRIVPTLSPPTSQSSQQLSTASKARIWIQTTAVLFGEHCRTIFIRRDCWWPKIKGFRSRWSFLFLSRVMQAQVDHPTQLAVVNNIQQGIEPEPFFI